MEIKFLVPAFISSFIINAFINIGSIYTTFSIFPFSINNKTTTTAKPFASSWEDVGDWNIEDGEGFKTYTFKRSMPELTDGILKKGVVMVWTKNLIDPTLGSIEKPLRTPFYFFPDNEQPNYTEYWYTTPQKGNIALSYKTNVIRSSVAQTPAKVKLRFILIPQDVLRQNKQSTSTVQKLTYLQLTNMLGIGQ